MEYDILTVVSNIFWNTVIKCFYLQVRKDLNIQGL
jgi:hypothetical protein